MSEYETENGDVINIAPGDDGAVWVSIIRNNRIVHQHKVDVAEGPIWRRGFIRGVTACSSLLAGIYVGSHLVEWITT